MWLTGRSPERVSSLGGNRDHWADVSEEKGMRRQIWRLWQLGRGRASAEPSAEIAAEAAAPLNELALPQPTQATPGQPEQPVLLSAGGAARPVHVGELLPARQRRWPLSVVQLPVVPKRAILEAGVFAGLAAPQIAKHLATRMLLGNQAIGPRGGVEGVLEITRIVYNGPLTPRAADAITKALTAGRR
jgi:hypothetical protein